MEIKDFIEKFAEQFEDTEVSVFKENTEFKTLDEWTSLMALSIIAMIDEEYDVRIKGNDIKSAVTIKDLFEIVKANK